MVDQVKDATVHELTAHPFMDEYLVLCAERGRDDERGYGTDVKGLC